MIGRSFVVFLAAGCGHVGAWELERMGGQSISGPQPFIQLHALGAASSSDLTIECAPNGLQMAFRGQGAGVATVQFDDTPPVVLPTATSLRGVPVIDLRKPIAGGSTTPEERLVAASRITVHPTPGGGSSLVVVYDVSQAERAIRRLHCD